MHSAFSSTSILQAWACSLSTSFISCHCIYRSHPSIHPSIHGFTFLPPLPQQSALVNLPHCLASWSKLYPNTKLCEFAWCNLCHLPCSWSKTGFLGCCPGDKNANSLLLPMDCLSLTAICGLLPLQNIHQISFYLIAIGLILVLVFSGLDVLLPKL